MLFPAGIEPATFRVLSGCDFFFISSKTAQYELYIYSCHLQELLFFLLHFPVLFSIIK